MTANSWRSVQVTGVAPAGVPADASAVQVTVTVLSSPSVGAASVSADLSTPKAQLVVNYGYESGADSNTSVLPLSSSGKIKLMATTAVNIVLDVQGFYTGGDTAAAGGYVTTSPTRIVNTTNGTGLPHDQIASGTTVTIAVAGLAGVPADASAVFVNIAVENYSGAAGWITPYAADTSSPKISMNYPDSATTSFGTTVPLSTDGKIKIFVGHGPIDLYVDVFGYFDGSATTGAFTPAVATVASKVAVTSAAVKAVPVTGLSGVPAVGSGISSVALSITASNANSDGGYITLWPTGTPQPATSALNFPHVASTVTNFVTTRVGSDGKINVYASSASITVSLTVLGWYTSTGSAIANGQSSTQQSVTLQANPAGGGAWVTYQYRNGITGSFTNVPVANVKDGNGAKPSAWPVTTSSGKFTPYVWNIRDTLAALSGNNGVAPDSLVQVQACYGVSSTDSNPACGVPSNVDFAQTDGSGSSADVGPGSVDELTGDFQLSATDADAATSLGALSIGRTLTTLAPANASGMAGVFGPGWTTDLDDDDAGSASLTPVDHSAQGYLQLTDTDGSETTYTQDPVTATQYDGAGADADDTSILTRPDANTIVLIEADATKTTWTKTSGGVWQVASVTQPGSNATTSYTYNGSGLATRILAPVPSGVSCSSPDTTPGCRSLKLVYGDGTTGPVGRLIEIDLSIPQTSSTANSIAVAKYDYDTAGRLAHAWDPRINPALKTAYTYTTGNRLATLTPPGLATWTLSYDASNRLNTVSRPDPSGSTATTTIVYGLSQAITGTNAGPVDLSADTTAHWGETADLPVTGTAIFDPDHTPAGTTVSAVSSSDWPYASIDYLDVNGQTVNSAAYGAGAWQLDTTQYDPSTGNELWSLTAGNRAQALTPTSDTDPYIAGLSSNVDRAALLRDETDYDPLTGNVTDTYGPTHPVTLAGGSVIDARTHVATSYDEGAPTTTVDPTTGTPVNPASLQPYGLPTTVTTTAYDVQAKTDTAWPDIQTTHTGYDPVVAGDTSGWTLGQASTSTTQMGQTTSSSDLVTRTRYDIDGRVIEHRLPNDTSGGTPRTTVTNYYTATGSGSCADPTRVGLVCSTAPGGQPASGSPLAVVTYAYNQYGDPTSKTETYGTGGSQVVRTNNTGYDTAERTSSSSITVAPTSAGGTAVPKVTYGYDPSTGLPTTATTGTGPSTVSLATEYNNIAKATSYTDATGNVSHIGYDLDGRPISLNDGKGTTTSNYDGTSEHRGMATGEDIGVSGSPSTFAATYDAAGNLATQTYPNGLVATRRYDNTGNIISLTYAKSGSTWLSFTQNVNALGQIANQTSPQSSQTLGYDPADRLTTVQDTYSGACTTRLYTFDNDSNRSNLKSYPGTGTGSATCSASTTPSASSYTYDAADRLASDTAGSYSYDSLGRTTSIPPGDAQGIGSHASITGTVTIGYYANDMVAAEQQASTTDGFTLDPDQNRVNTQSEAANTTTDHYDGDGDSPTWSSTGSGNWTRNIRAIDGNLSATTDQTGTVLLQLTNIHNDVVANASDSPGATGVNIYGENAEFGEPRKSSTANTKYGWLGGKQRNIDDLGGLSVMGQRLYNPKTGRFLSVDPIYMGNANSYTYPPNPVGSTDLSGRSESAPDGGGWGGDDIDPGGGADVGGGGGGGDHGSGGGGEETQLRKNRAAGKAAEDRVEGDQNHKKINTPSGRKRVPDRLNKKLKTMGEIKSVRKLYFTRQLRDMFEYAKKYHYSEVFSPGWSL